MTDNYSTISLAVDDQGVATLTLDRPDRHNAMDAAMIAELHAAAKSLGADASVRVVVLTGEGESFCAGADLQWMQAQFEATRAQRIQEATALAMMLKALNELPKPLVGRINGQAYGGGLGLVSVCDAAIACDTARFAFTETKLGLIPATISPFVVARIAEPLARHLFMSARPFGAVEGQAFGLFADVAPADRLDAAVAAQVASYLPNASAAMAASKRLVRQLGHVIDDAVIERVSLALAETWETDEAKAGVSAFLERRSSRR